MSRRFLAVYPALLHKTKYRRLTLPARAALFHIWCLAAAQSPEATWRTEAELAEVLELDGYDAAVLDELAERGWLDVDDNGRWLVHDWDEHQLAASDEIRRSYEADRKRAWRRTKSASPSLPAPSLPDRTEQSRDITGSPGHVPDKWGNEWRPFLEEWGRRFRYPPSESQRATLWEIIDARPTDAVRWLAEAPRTGKSHDAVGFVLRRWHDVRREAAA